LAGTPGFFKKLWTLDIYNTASYKFGLMEWINILAFMNKYLSVSVFSPSGSGVDRTTGLGTVMQRKISSPPRI
jgi:hypothetical protein